jgi:hypothetical protein
MAAVSLRILFVARPGTLLRFSQVVPALAERGHRVHVALTNEPDAGPRELLEGIAGQYPSITYGPAPARGELDGWGQVAWLVRGVVDVARYSHPRYPPGSRLRKRMKKRILGRLERPGEFEPLGRRLALRVARRSGSAAHPDFWRCVIRTGALLEDAIPTSHRVDRYVREQTPDVVLATGVLEEASEEIEFVKSANRLGIPSGVCVASWDLLTNKGLLKCRPDRVFVWNENQVREVAEMHGLPAERVRPTGAHAFDEWFARRPSTTAEEFIERVGLPPGSPYIVYASSSPDITKRREPAFVARWIEAIRASDDELVGKCPIIIRPYPKALSDWRKFDGSRFENVILWPAVEVFSPADEARAEFYDTLFYCSAVVGANTTAMLEANILGKTVLSVLVRDFAQKETLHFPYLQLENGGFLQIAPTLEEHIVQLGRALRDPTGDAETRRRFLESFVRPGGIDRSAAPILAEAVEELAGAGAERRELRAATMALRPLLALEAGLSTLHALSRVRVGMRPTDDRVAAKTQRAVT